ncbi:zinc-binding protein A33-like [Heptranchias perlo]|uniref:zinc-binding protein A33-like n=1 Tax=Heptranchias perlo TaxID=212740 RepID=UPI00355AA1E0
MAAARGCCVESALHRELICSVCLELFQEPVILKCGHNFCQGCILHVWESRERQRRVAGGRGGGANSRGRGASGGTAGAGSGYSCPECRQTFPNKNFTKNFLAANLVEKLQEIKSASNSHGRSVPKRCEKHQKPMTVYCRTDHKILCNLCRLSRAHRSCDVLLAHELTEEFPKRKKELKARIRKEFAKLIEFLIEEREIFLVQLDVEEQAAMEEVEAGRMDLGATIVELEQSIADIQSKLNRSVPLEEMLDSISRPIPRLEKSTMAKLNPRWELFTGPLQFIAWKRMLDIVNPGLVNLYFNPVTAHPNLKFNGDCTAVESSSSRAAATPDSPERFNRFQAVLASAHFTSGRCYWEVYVGDCVAWYLGVTCVHSTRKGYVKLAPTNGYWSICRLLDYWANNERRRPLAVDSDPSKVGVYLDFDGGQVSFYDASCMTLLCTFKTTFRCPVVPFFSPSREVGGVLKLCHF